MLLAQIRLAADRQLECRAGILRLIGVSSGHLYVVLSELSDNRLVFRMRVVNQGRLS